MIGKLQFTRWLEINDMLRDLFKGCFYYLIVLNRDDEDDGDDHEDGGDISFSFSTISF